MDITRSTKADFAPQPRDIDGNVRVSVELMDLREALAHVADFDATAQAIFHVGEDEDGFICLTIEFVDGEKKPAPKRRRSVKVNPPA